MTSLAKYGMLPVLCVVLSLLGCGGKTEKDGKDGKDSGSKVDQSSPEKVAESFKAAAKDKDWKSMLACTTEDSHKMLIIGAMFGAGFATLGDKSKEEALEALMKKHGIDPKKKSGPDDDPTKDVKDKAALLGDLVEFMEKNSPAPKDGKPRKTFSEQFSSVELSNFKTEGDTATADVTQNGKKKSKPIDFKKIDGKWYIHFESERRKARGFPKAKS